MEAPRMCGGLEEWRHFAEACGTAVAICAGSIFRCFAFSLLGIANVLLFVRLVEHRRRRRWGLA